MTNSRECWVVWSGACWEGQTWQENIRIHSLTGYMTRLIENIWNLDWAYLAADLCHEEDVNLTSTDLETTTANVPRTTATSELTPTRTIIQLSCSSQVTSASDISAILGIIFVCKSRFKGLYIIFKMTSINWSPVFDVNNLFLAKIFDSWKSFPLSASHLIQNIFHWRTGSIRAAEVDRMDAGSRRKSSGVGDNPPHCQDENGGQLLGNEVFSICDTFEKKSCREET